MNRSERQSAFTSHAARDPLCQGQDWKSSDSFGFSNSTKFITGGVYLGTYNLERSPESKDGVVFNCIHPFPGGQEVYYSVFVDEDVGLLRERLELMVGAAQVDGEGDAGPYGDYSETNNLVRTYLAEDGQLYLHNAKYLNEIDEDFRAESQPALSVDKIDWAVWPGDQDDLGPGAREFVGYLSELTGPDTLERIDPWDGPDRLDLWDERRPEPEDLSLDAITSRITELGGYYPDRLVRRLHVGLNHLPRKHFVILTGLSGTGKTDLVQKYSQAVHGISRPEAEDPLFFLCAVRPDWTDPSGLTGYHDVISDRYVVPTFLEALLTANNRPDASVFVCLDEMNLAHVEHYFADVLSAMETGLPLDIHSHAVPLKGTTGDRIPGEVPYPDNLYLAGTVNIDETTRPISDKVLDRAVVVDTSDVDLGGFLRFLAEENPELEEAMGACSPILEDLEAILSAGRNGFGYRVAEEFVRYHRTAMSLDEERDSRDVIDEQIVQRILTGLSGTERQRQMLEDLADRLEDLPLSTEVVDELRSDLDEFGSFEALR